MAESESNLANHAGYTFSSGVSAKDKRAKATQILSADFITGILQAAARRGIQSMANLFGIDADRTWDANPRNLAISGFVYNDDMTLDTTTTPGTVRLTMGENYGVHGAQGDLRVSFSVTRRRGGGEVPQRAGYLETQDFTELTDVPFASTTTEYTVALTIATIPSEVTANPRTGGYEYTEEETILGYVFAPDTVTDLGGSIELQLPDNVFLSNDSMAGRQCWVYLANGPLTDEVNAIVKVPVTFSGWNRVTVTGTLGQGTVSTTPSDYRLCLIGPIVSDKRMVIGASPNFVEDAEGFAAIGVINYGGTPNSNFLIRHPVFTNSRLLGVLSPVPDSPFSGPSRVKVDVKADDSEDGNNSVQVMTTSNPSNAKWGGLRSWFVNQDGEQYHCTTQTDFRYPPDDSTMGTTQTRFAKFITPVNRIQALVDATGGGALLGEVYDTALIAAPFWTCTVTGNWLTFFVPWDVNNVSIREIHFLHQRVTAGDIIKVTPGQWQVSYSSPQMLEDFPGGGTITIPRTGAGLERSVTTLGTPIDVIDNRNWELGWPTADHIHGFKIEIYNDGVVGVGDILIVVGSWGPCDQ